jgi:hypothetical protein
MSFRNAVWASIWVFTAGAIVCGNGYMVSLAKFWVERAAASAAARSSKTKVARSRTFDLD